MAFEFFTESAPDKGEMYLTYYVEIQLALWTSLETTPLPRLRSLCIGSMVSCFPYGLEEDDSLLTIFHSLITSLSISGVSLFQARRLPPEILNFSVNLSHILLAARNITSLQLGLEDLAGPTSPFQFENLRFPALASLTLHTIVFAGLADGEEPLISSIQGQGLTVEKFILNHKATLQRLELHDCVAAVPDGAWHRVFRRFRLQLSELVEFVWTTQATERNENFHYARPVGTLETYTL
ncbi:hypothetical protein C8R43DRAFT_1132897 [Mycena crocata]|nr:hypothetical protein C8R43DRAFT_1132897 [Mycena crocata]